MEITIFNWNIQGTKYYTKTSLGKILPNLENVDADIFCIQEGQELNKKINELKYFKEFNSDISYKNENGAQLTISKYSIVNSVKLNLPAFKKDLKIQSLRTDINLGEKILRIYNCHLEIFKAGPLDRLEQLKYVLEDSKKHNGPIVICGDLNSVIPKKGLGRLIAKSFHKQGRGNFSDDVKFKDKAEKYLMLDLFNDYGFKNILDINKATWGLYPLKWELFNLKLDWFLVKDINVIDFSLGKYISDHRSITVKLVLD